MVKKLTGIAIVCLLVAGCLLSTGCPLKVTWGPASEPEPANVGDVAQDLIDALDDWFEDFDL